MKLTVNRINKSFGDKHVLKDLEFEVNGGAFGLLGRNGSGKTTTIRIVMDVFPADSGAVLLDGKPMSKFTGRIGYLPEERGLYPKRPIVEQMAYIGALRGMKAADARKRGLQLLEKLGAEEYYKRKLDTLSKGNQQKIQLAIALINDPELVILDEPFSGLDPVNAKVLKDLVSELVKDGRTVLFSSHQMANVEEFCDNLCIINSGEVVLAGNLRDIKKTYPRNRVLLVPQDENSGKLAQSIQTHSALAGMVESAEAAAQGCVVTLKNPDDKSSLLRTVTETSGLGLDLDVFRVVEPTLEEIFVEKCGNAPVEEAVEEEIKGKGAKRRA